MESIAMPNRNCATFVLVHGAWHGGWSYARVHEVPKLRDLPPNYTLVEGKDASIGRVTV
jgi:hypothetical protein